MDVSSERRPVKLVEPMPEWAEMAKFEATRLRGAIGDNLIAVHHIGSTSIPGIMAKPTIDLLPTVKSVEALDGSEAALRDLGYDWRGEFGLPGRRFLTMTKGESRIFNVHCYEATNPEVTRHLAFRDYLIANPDIARAYEAEKIRAAELEPDDVLKYNDAKNDWIKETERRALEWYRKRI